MKANLESMQSEKPEQLSLWDWLFHRYKKTVIDSGTDTWHKNCKYTGKKLPDSEFSRDYVLYKIVDRATGSVKIERQYLN